ncbi:hypothetical protein FNH07_35445 [Amycolatopsis bartoniae]|uniref:Lipoprotein n=1 Tax=Amycolatopsis bartoniae TaxID=941986 RepID=A0A8H9J502_9PSEU|nr:hypothetical protein FNH07_35445 [Amycolatopsis bartoniae]GHF88354.1 hypothetical protein GCM10017566_72700 [Amycolatopsis bartoniae]
MLAGVMLLVSACSSAKAGTPVPNGAEAAAYVSAKFSATLDKLGDRFNGVDSRKSVLDTFARFDNRKINSTVTAVQLGRPPARLAKNHSNLDSNEYLDSYHPANSPVEYLLLGPVYASLAPTHWVSMPYTAGDLNECFWAGTQDVCKMLGAVSDSVDQGRAKTASSKADGGVELTADVTLDAYLTNRVVVFPQDILDQIGADMKTKTLQARIVLDPAGKLTEIELGGTISGGGHELELRSHYRLDGTPTENDLPKIPDPSDVTVLADSAAVSDFYARMGEIQGR